MKAGKAYQTLRAARNDERLVGIRLKKSKEEKDDKKPVAAAGAGDD
jgi:hypothetical protein